MKNSLFISHIISLLLGGSIYILFRDPSLLLFGWLDTLGLSDSIATLQLSMVGLRELLPSWVIFSLPDALWLFSYVCLILFIWRKSINKFALVWVFTLPLLAIIFEFSQLSQAVTGTFDPIDLFLYIAVTILPFALFRKNINFSGFSKKNHDD